MCPHHFDVCARAAVLRKTGELQAASAAIEKKLVAREDLKLTDLLRYYVADADAAKALLWRRIKAFNEMEVCVCVCVFSFN